MSTQQMPVAEFCEHTMDALQAVEKHRVHVELVRDGQVIAYLSPAVQPLGTTGTLADWMGTGAGYTLAAGESLDDPTFSPEEWEDFPESSK